MCNGDADSGPRGLCVVAAMDKFTRPTEVLWRKRDSMATLWVRETALTPAWTGFYCFSGYITWRMALIYYAQVCFRWLPFTENKGEDVANYITEGYLQMQREKWLNWLLSSLGGLT